MASNKSHPKISLSDLLDIFVRPQQSSRPSQDDIIISFSVSNYATCMWISGTCAIYQYCVLYQQNENCNDHIDYDVWCTTQQSQTLVHQLEVH